MRLPEHLLLPESAILLDRWNKLVIDVPGEVDPLVLAEFLDTQVDDLAAHRFGVERGEIGLGQQFADHARGVAGVDQIVDQQIAFAVVVDALEDLYRRAGILRTFFHRFVVTGRADGIQEADFQFASDQRGRNHAATGDGDDALERTFLHQRVAEQARVAVQFGPGDYDIVPVGTSERRFHGAFLNNNEWGAL